MKRVEWVGETGRMRIRGRESGAIKQSVEELGLTVRQWGVVAAVAICAILMVFVISPRSNYPGTTGMFFISAEGEPPLILKPESDGYDLARAELEGFQAKAPGTYSVSLNTYLSIKSALGLKSGPEDEARLARWNERTEHWSNLRAFLSSANVDTADGVIAKEDVERICSLMPEWEGQLSAARAYVADYREVEPDTVRRNPVLENLESEANRGLALLSETNCSGAAASLK